MIVHSYMTVVPSADLEKSLRFWVNGLGLTPAREFKQNGQLIGCMVQQEAMFFWLSQRAGEPIPAEFEGVRFYWTPKNLPGAHAHLKQLGFAVSELEERDYGQTEFFLTDDDGYSHCFGVATAEL